VRAAIGLDVGTTAVKALAVDESGAVVARAEAGYALSTPRPRWAEQDPADWWAATERALAELRVCGAGVATTAGFHRAVLAHPVFRAGEHTIAFVDDLMSTTETAAPEGRAA
jgi:hypothetical protein